MPGRTDDFRRLDRKLIVVATELDSGVAVRFGSPGFDHVPISRAVQASSALPGLYPPVLIDGHHYVDGVLLKTMHASVALDAGAKLVICVNPIVPVDTLHGGTTHTRRRRLTELGLPTVLSQAFRTLIHSRMTTGLAAYAPRFPNRDLVLFEPAPDDYWMFFTNIFSFSSRKDVAEAAYRATRRDLLFHAVYMKPRPLDLEIKNDKIPRVTILALFIFLIVCLVLGLFPQVATDFLQGISLVLQGVFHEPL